MPASFLRPAFAIALAVTCMPVDAALDVTATLHGLSSASVATVVLVPPMAVYQKPIDRTGLQTAGCHYTTADTAAIHGLIALVKSAAVTANPVYQQPDIREGVYFAMDDGSKFSVLFADNAGSRLPAMGIAETTSGGQIQSVSVSLKSTLSTDVREWAKRNGGAGTGSSCGLQSGTAEDPQAPPAVPQPSR